MVQMPDESKLLTPVEVSKLLGVPVTTLAVWRCTGRVKLAYIKVGSAVRYAMADLQQLIQENRHEAV